MSLPASYFDRMYGESADPWGFGDRWYEQRKRAATIAALPHERYRAAFEPGCSLGFLSLLLAERCDRLLCADVSAAAVAAARHRLAGRDNVDVQQRSMPQEWPEGAWDLVVLSEIGYYFDADSLSVLVGKVSGALLPGGVLLACHWRHPVPDYPLTGDVVHERLGETPGLARVVRHEEADFLLDVYLAGTAQSVAERTGLV